MWLNTLLDVSRKSDPSDDAKCKGVIYGIDYALLADLAEETEE